ncbi:hypothetical protein PF003_g23413 [Phytophthora fragariae]|nr:hypothetical protein PF003_g23413 [Phytophthora fragariae]
MGTPIRPALLIVPYSRGREHHSRHRIEGVGEREPRTHICRADPRLVPSPDSDVHTHAHDRLAQRLRKHSVASSSFKTYNRALSHWKLWTARRGVPWQLVLPLDNQLRLISDFTIDSHRLGFDTNSPVKSSTIRLNLHGIRHFFQASGLPFPSDHPQIRTLPSGLGRIDRPVQQKTPVSVALLEPCFRALDLHDPADQALWGVLCLAFFFVLRRSEIMATTTTKFRWFALKAENITATNAAGVPTTDPRTASAVCIRLRGSKTNQSGAPTTRVLARSGHPTLCPVFGALVLLRARGNLPVSIPAAVFTDNRGVPSCVSAARVTSSLRHAAQQLGESPHKYSAHSLRAGGATHMYKAGVDALTIQFHGRWASNTLKLYTRLCTESVASVKAKMVGGATRPSTLR